MRTNARTHATAPQQTRDDTMNTINTSTTNASTTNASMINDAPSNRGEHGGAWERRVVNGQALGA